MCFFMCVHAWASVAKFDQPNTAAVHDVVGSEQSQRYKNDIMSKKIRGLSQCFIVCGVCLMCVCVCVCQPWVFRSAVVLQEMSAGFARNCRLRSLKLPSVIKSLSISAWLFTALNWFPAVKEFSSVVWGEVDWCLKRLAPIKCNSSHNVKRRKRILGVLAILRAASCMSVHAISTNSSFHWKKITWKRTNTCWDQIHFPFRKPFARKFSPGLYPGPWKQNLSCVFLNNFFLLKRVWNQK